LFGGVVHLYNILPFATPVRDRLDQCAPGGSRVGDPLLCIARAEGATHANETPAKGR
jgi:hypothetical protein